MCKVDVVPMNRFSKAIEDLEAACIEQGFYLEQKFDFPEHGYPRPKGVPLGVLTIKATCDIEPV